MPLSEVVIIVARLLIGNSVLYCFLLYNVQPGLHLFGGVEVRKKTVWVGTRQFLTTSLFSILLCKFLL